MPQAPNVLWVCTDSQRWDTLGANGNPWVRSPNLDRLAGQGVCFTQCHSQSPVCTPSRAAFLTGRYPRTCRVRQNGQLFPREEVLITRLLAEAGYVGGLSGKLHVSAANPSYCEIEPRVNDGYAEFHWSHHPDEDWSGGKAEYNQWLRERGVELKRNPVADCRWITHGMPEQYHQTTWCADKAIEFIKARATRDKPWFFSMNPFDPHDGFDPPESYLRRYVDQLDEIPLPNYVPGELDNKPVFQQIDHRGAYNNPHCYPYDEMSERDHRYVRAAYWAMCDLIDAQVGRVLETLDRTGRRDNTIIIFSSDHGEMLGDHGIYLKGPYLYDPAVRVPLIMSWPGRIQTGVQCDTLVELIDIAPTVLDLVGLPRPPGMQSRSLVPLVTGETDAHREDVYSEFHFALTEHEDPRSYATMVRTREHKIVVQHGRERGELYDLQTDPQETHNLWDDPAAADVKMAMLKRLCDRTAFTIDPLPERVARW